jgi:hypothetical protein
MFFAVFTAAFTICLNLCHIRGVKARLSWEVKLCCSRSWQNHKHLIQKPSAWRYAGKRGLVTYSNDTVFHFSNTVYASAFNLLIWTQFYENYFSKAGIILQFLLHMTTLNLQNGSLFLSCISTSWYRMWSAMLATIFQFGIHYMQCRFYTNHKLMLIVVPLFWTRFRI